MHYHQLIIGQGLAGSLLAYQLIKREQNILVVDSCEEHTASHVAAGMFTPVSGKRMVKSWMVDTLYPVMQQTYQELEKLLNESFLTNQNIQLSFGSIKEQNDFFSALTDKIEPYVNQNINPNPGLNAPFGAVEIKQSGWVNTVKLLKGFRHYLLQRNAFWNHTFNEANLTFKDGCWCYGAHSFNQVVFCQGYKNKYSTLFSSFHVIENKGDVFKLKTNALDNLHIYKRGCYAVCLEDNTFKVGSTYHWNNDNPTPTQAGFDELKLKTDALINGRYEVIEHLVGIRPTTKDRKPILEQHPTQKGLFIFNGLGTKGVMLAPYFSIVMAEWLTTGKIVNDSVQT